MCYLSAHVLCFITLCHLSLLFLPLLNKIPSEINFKSKMTFKPFLLYAYPWMPFPRRVTIFLREKNISPSLVAMVPVSDPRLGNAAPPKFPSRPPGSLPILAIPSIEPTETEPYTYIRQSLATMNYLDELCDSGEQGFPQSQYSCRGHDALSRARVTELLCLADECTIAWNPVRTFGTGASTMSLPAASMEMVRWIYRSLTKIEGYFAGRDFSDLRHGGTSGPNMAEIVLYQFLEFTKDCYGRDVTKGPGGLVKDVYGRDVIGSFPKLEEFYEAFKTRPSAERRAEVGEVAGKAALECMQTWAEGSL